MKPYGREKKIKHFYGKKDFNIIFKNKKLENWWEEMCTIISRKSIKQSVKKRINNELNE